MIGLELHKSLDKEGAYGKHMAMGGAFLCYYSRRIPYCKRHLREVGGWPDQPSLSSGQCPHRGFAGQLRRWHSFQRSEPPKVDLQRLLIFVLCFLLVSWPNLSRAGEAVPDQSNLTKKAELFLKEGEQRLRGEEYARAADILRQAVELYGEAGERGGEARARLHRGRVYLAVGDYPQARVEIERALELFQGVSDQVGEAEARLELGRLQRHRGSYPEARQQIETALSLYQRRPDKRGEAAAYLETGRIHYSQGRYQEALGSYNIALAGYQALGDSKGEADARLHMAWALRFLQDHERSRSEARTALALYRKVPSQLGEAEARFALGVLDALQGDYPQAESVYKDSISVYRRLDARQHLADAVRSLARLHKLQGQYHQAQSAFGEALALYQRMVDRDGEANIKWSLGDILRLQGRYREALEAFEAALHLYKDLENLQGIGDVNQDLGLLYHSQGRYPEAQQAFKTALALYQKTVNQLGEGYAHRNLALLYGLQSSYAQARAEIEEAIKIFQHRKSLLGEAYSRLEFGTLLRRQNRNDDSEMQYKRSIELFSQIGVLYGEAEVKKELGALFRIKGQLDEAKKVLSESQKLASQLQASEILWQVLYELGRIYEQERNLEEALKMYQQAVSAIDDLVSQFGQEELRAQYLQAGGRLAVYDALTTLLLELHEKDPSRGYNQQALEVMQAKSTRTVMEVLLAARPRFLQEKLDQVSVQEQVRKERQTRATRDQLEGIQPLITEGAKTKKDLFGAMEKLFQKKVSLSGLVANLRPGTLTVIFFSAPSKLHIFVAAPRINREIQVEISREDLHRLVREYRTHVELMAKSLEERVEKDPNWRIAWEDDGSETYRKNVKPFKDLTRRLGKYLLEPIQPWLQSHRDIILLPTDSLSYLPIHALTLEQPDGSLRFLAETHKVSYLTMAALPYILASPQITTEPLLLALGNPDGRLPGASEEIQKLREIRPASRPPLLGTRATKKAFIRNLEEFIDLKMMFDLHLATHAKLNPLFPQESYLLMAGSDQESQHLYLGEIYDLTIPARLAVLSACETALGEQVPGEAGADLMTLAHAFSDAGTKSIVASLWRVYDPATRDFMVALHKALLRAGPAEALNAAQLALLKNPGTAHPFYWAPFILIGAR